jgi:uncharacterized membrane protein YdbT with pleckstrin-like domain
MQKMFPDQKEGEAVLVFLRRHWLTFFPSILIIFVLFLIPLVAFLAIKLTGLVLDDFRPLVILGFSSEILIGLAFFVASFIDYYLDVSIVTNQRIVDIEQKGLFNRSIAQQELARVQDVKTRKAGIFQTFFDYGDVFIQTAGEAPNFEFKSVPKPDEAAQKIMALHHDILEKGYKEPEEKLAEPPQEGAEEGLKEIPKMDE